MAKQFSQKPSTSKGANKGKVTGARSTSSRKETFAKKPAKWPKR